MIASYETRPIPRPTPKQYYSFSPSSSHHPMQTHSLPTTPLASSSKTKTTTTTTTTTTTKRPKALTKKNSVSTRDKRQDVQINLEAKVEKSKGFHAFFVPLGRGIPAAPPSSPVLGAQREQREQREQGEIRKDYFEDWVEDVRGSASGCSESSGGEGMDLD